MKNPRNCVLVLGILAAVTFPARSQGTGMADPDVKKLADALGKAYPWPGVKTDDKKKQAGREELGKEIERVTKALGTTPLLSLTAAWQEIFALQRVPLGTPSGLGRVDEKTVPLPVAGKAVEFKYGLILPNAYDPKKRYGLIVALHDRPEKDKQTTGAKYLEEVWMNKVLPKEERDKFIIMAPTWGPNAGGKDIRIEPGDRFYDLNIVWPMNDVQTKYSVDNARIYLDGTGDGGTLALQLVSGKPYQWAGVAIRNGLTKDVQLLQNAASVPIALHYRKGGPVTSAADFLTGVEQLKTVNGCAITTKEYDPLPPAAERTAKGTQANDPVHDATPAIVAGFTAAPRNQAIKKLTFATTDRLFNRSYWVRLGRYETDAGGAKITAEIDAASNTINLTTNDHIEEFRLFLTDAIVDLGKPVKVTLNGKPYAEKQFERSIEDFLKFYGETQIDPGLVPSVIFDMKVPAAAPESKPAGDPPKD